MSRKEPPSEEDALHQFKTSRQIPQDAPICLAPWTSISFAIDGYANICCLNKKTAVKLQGQSIRDIWKSEAFETLRKNILNNNLHYDCSICLSQIKAGNYLGVKAATYDTYFPTDPKRPVVMEFCLENTCNLACTMCNSVLSSTIRKQRKLPPLQKHYDEHFVAQLDEYIPHLKEAIFSGGEPFLIPLYFKIWEKMLRLNPSLTISIVTNGTVLNDTIKHLLERGRFHINISLDAVDKDLYERIRQNADFDQVMQNFRWFRDYGIRKELPVNVPICPLTTNWHNIPNIVRFANQNDVFINFVYVERPASLSLVNAAPDLLKHIISVYRAQPFTTSTEKARQNIKRFHGLIDDLEKYYQHQQSITATPHSVQDSLKSWEEKILLNTKIDNISNNVNARHELIQLIGDALNEVPADKREAVIGLLNKFADERLYEYVKNKSPREVATIFLEFAGI